MVGLMGHALCAVISLARNASNMNQLTFCERGQSARFCACEAFMISCRGSAGGAKVQATRLQLMMYVAGYESEVEEDATERPVEETFQEQKVERRKAEPYDVPTSGAFWMHDDRMDDEEFAASGCVSLSALSFSATASFLPYMPAAAFTFLLRPLYSSRW